MELYDANVDPVPNERGAAFLDSTWDAAGRVERVVFRGPDGAILPQQGDLRVTRNRLGLPIEWQERGADGRLRWRLALTRDSAQGVSDMRTLDEGGAVVLGPLGWARASFARQGPEVVARYEDAGGAPLRSAAATSSCSALASPPSPPNRTLSRGGPIGGSAWTAAPLVPRSPAGSDGPAGRCAWTPASARCAAPSSTETGGR